MTLESTALPKDWRTVKLETLCNLVRGASPRPKGDPRYFGGSIPWISIADLSREEGKVLTRTKEGVTPAGAKLSRLLAKGTLIVSNSATICVPKILGVAGCIHDGFVALTELSPKADIHYLFHFFNAVREEVRAKNTQGVTQVNLNTGIFKAMDVPLPPLAEQRRIAEVLDRAEALRAKRRAALAQLDTLSQAIFINLFDAEKQFNIAALGDVASLKRGPFGGALKKETFIAKGYQVYEQRNAIQDDFLISRYFLSESKYREMEDFAVVPHDLIVSCSGTLGKVAIAPEGARPGVINQALLRIRVDGNKVTPLYLKHMLESVDTQNKLSGISHGTGLQNFPPMSDVKALRMVLPPLALQQDFARRIAAVEKLKAAHRASLAELDALFAALQHRAFRGEL